LIRSERLLMRRARPDDLDAFHEIMTDARVMRYWSHPPHETLHQTQRFLAHMMRSDEADIEEYVIELGGRAIGKAGCWRRAEAGFLLHPDFWGRGLAQEAMRAVLPACFAKFADVPHLTAECDPRNTASVALLRRLGFRHLRTVEKDFLYGAQEWCDTAYFDLPRP
jgi:RimJ/RimL family protein N-acetyltransferase